MKVSQLSESDFVRELRQPGLWLRTGPFQTHIRSTIDSLARAIHLLYGDFTIAENPEFADFHVRLARPRGLRRWYRPQVFFYFDEEKPFKPLALSQVFAMFEWCMNWCVSCHANQYLIIHAAIIERLGRAAILAAPPGSGKSTLTAALINRGWRLLSDELTLIDLAGGMAVPITRPVSLKNESIAVIRDFVPGAVIGPLSADTVKGTVAHLKPPVSSVERTDQAALPAWVIFPKYQPDASVSLTPFPKPNALLRLADNSFNYSQLGLRGFETLSELIDKCDCYEFTYSKLEDAIAVFNSLSS